MELAAIYSPRRSRGVILVVCMAVNGGCASSDPTPPVVDDFPVATVTVSGVPSKAFLVGDSVALVATPRSAAGATLTNRTITWSTSAPSIATVSSAGQVRALREGVVLITASAAGQIATVSLDIAFGRVVTDSGGALRNADSSFFLNMPASIFPQPTLLVVRLLNDSLGDSRVVPGTIFSVGSDTTKFFGFASLKLRFADAKVPRSLAIESMQLHVRTAAGWVPAFRASLDFEPRVVDGSIQRGGIYAVRSMPVSRIVVTGINAGGALYSGGTGALVTEVFDSVGFRLPDRRVAWSSSAPAIVSVDSLGRLLAGAAGTATITATADGRTGTTTVTSIVGAPSDFSRAADWTTFQGSFQHSGFVEATINPAQLRAIWTSRPLASAMLSQATTGGGKIFLSTQTYETEQTVIALNPADGSTMWMKRLDRAGRLNQPTYSNGVLYVTSNDYNAAYLHALGDVDGAVRYQVPFEGFQGESNAPVIVGSTITTPGGLYGGLYGFDLVTGAQRFFRSVSTVGRWAPSVHDGRLYTSDRGFQAVNAADGTLASEVTDARFTVTTLAVNRSAQAVGVTEGFLVSFNTASLAIAFAKSGFDAMPVFGDDIYAFAGDRVEALRFGAASVFSYVVGPTCSMTRRSMVLTSNILFISCANEGGLPGFTVAIDTSTRLAAWNYPVGGTLSLSAQGVLYIVNNDQVTAIRAF